MCVRMGAPSVTRRGVVLRMTQCPLHTNFPVINGIECALPLQGIIDSVMLKNVLYLSLSKSNALELLFFSHQLALKICVSILLFHGVLHNGTKQVNQQMTNLYEIKQSVKVIIIIKGREIIFAWLSCDCVE